MRTTFSGLGVGLVIALASASTALAAAPAGSAGGGAVAFNGHDANAIAQVVWGTSDPVTGAGRTGGMYGDVESFGTIVGLWETDGHAAICDAGTPADPSDDFLAMSGTGRSGDGQGTVAIASDLRSALVTGVMTITSYAFDECAGTWTVVATETGVPMRLDLVATGRPTTDSSSSHDLLPGVDNTHQITNGISRWATGTATLAGRPVAFDAGLLSRNRWSYHENVRS